MNPTQNEQRPKETTWLAAILLLEALAMLGVGVFLVVEVFLVGADELGATLFLAALAVLCAFFLVQTGRAVLDGRSWSRSATAVWNVLQMGMSFGTFNGAEGPVPLALAMFVPAIAALVLVFRPPTRNWLARERDGLLDA